MAKQNKTKSRTQAQTKNPYVVIGTPMYGGQCAGVYTEALIMTSRLLRDLNIPHAYSFLYNESLITRGRNAIVKNFLSTPEATHLMFIDADIKFNGEDIIRMMQADKDIICGIYPMKGINWLGVEAAVKRGVSHDNLKHHTGLYVVNLVNYNPETEFNINDPLEIWNGGTGFMLIKREVFEKLAETCPKYTNDMIDQNSVMKLKDEIVEYFSTSIEPETNRLLSEDFHFCRIARQAGFKIYAAPWAKLTHYGTFAFEGNLVSTTR